MIEGNNFATTKHSPHVSSKMVLRFLQHVLYIHVENVPCLCPLYHLWGRNFLLYRNEGICFFFTFKQAQRNMRRETRGGNDVLLSLNINLRCPTKLPLFQAGVQKRNPRGASFTLWPWQWYGLSNSQDSANPHLLISPRLLLTSHARLFAHRLTDDAQSPEMLVI